MNLILLSPDQLLTESSAKISGDQFVHITKILKIAIGDTLRVGLINGSLGIATVSTIRDSYLIVEFELNQSPTPALPITLVVAMARPQTVKKILSIATVMGVKEIFFLHTKRVQKSYWDSPVLREESLYRHLHEGLQQTVDTIMPTILFRKRFEPFVEDELPLLLENSKAYVFHPTECDTKLQLEKEQKYTFIIGPEGGFIDYEIDKLSEIGVDVVSLGKRIMRVEQALNTILGYSAISLDL